MEMKNISPLDNKIVKAKIANTEVKVKGKQPKVKHETKANEKPKTAEPEKLKAEKKTVFTDEQFIEALKKIGHAATSREISDTMGIKDPDVGRQLVRSRMKKLNEAGKIYISEAPEGVRADKVYSLP
jgi:hypothetical protein